MQIKQHAPADYIINKAMAKKRESAWGILVDHHAPTIWPPHLVDLALASAQSMREITFQRLCDCAVRLNSKGTMGSLSLEIASLDPAQPFLLGWCKQRVMAWRSRHSLRNNFETEEVMYRLRELVIAKSEHYQPHRYCGDCIVTHGYEAWLTWLSKGLFSSLDRSLRGLPSCSLDKAITDDRVETLHDIIADPRVSPDTECIRYIRDELRAALHTPDEWSLFFELMYSGKSLRKIVGENGGSRSSISRNVARPIVRRLQSKLGEWYADRRHSEVADITHIARKAAALWTQEEFLLLCPPPLPAQVPVRLPALRDLPFHRTDASKSAPAPICRC